MKYINKKLPLLKVGEEIRYMNQDVSGVHCFESNGLHCSESTLKKLISEGWIEEVKPREWWEIERTDVSFHYDDRFRSYEDAEDVRNSTYKNSRIIKVQEVME